jgi:hypothetical protein
LGPKQTLNAGAFRAPNGNPVYFPHGCFLDAAEGKYKYIHIWGWAKYKDILRPEIKRITRFCWRIFGTLNAGGKLEFNHYLCDEGNCQDDACNVYDRMSGGKMPELELCKPLSIPNNAAVVPAAPPPIEPAPPPK